MFADILPTTGTNVPKLEPGQEYTITIQTDSTWQPTVSSVEEVVKANVGGLQVLKVDRGYFSNRFTITIKPLQILGLNTTLNQLMVGMKMAGKPASVVQIETGAKSTKPGGIKQEAMELVKGVSEGASDIGKEAVKPLIPWVIAGVVGLIAYTWWRTGGLERAMKPKQPVGVGKSNYASETT